MANKIQKKIAAAISNKKLHAIHHSRSPYNTWQHALNESEFGILIPSLTDCQIDIEKYRSTESIPLQELFKTIVDYLKMNYFDHQLNNVELESYLDSLYQKILPITDPEEQQEILVSYFREHRQKISLIYINNQPDLAVRFSKLAMSVLNRQIKDGLAIAPNQYDNENICKLINELSELAPDLQSECLLWLEEQLNAYQFDSSATSDDEFLPEDPISLATPTIPPTEDIAAIIPAELLEKQYGSYNDILIHYANSEPTTILTPEKINKQSINQVYRKLHNKLSKELHFEKSDHEKQQQFIVEIINCRINNVSQPPVYSLKNIKKICHRQLKVQRSIIQLCHKIENQRFLINEFIEKINTLPSSNETSILRDFFNKKLQAPLYLKISNKLQKIIKYERFRSYKSFTVDLIQYIKLLVTLPILESSLILQMYMEHDSLFNPYSSKDLLQISNLVKRLEQNVSSKAVKGECTYLLHTLIYNEEFSNYLQKLEALINANFKETITYLLDPLLDDESLHLIETVNKTTVTSTAFKEMVENNKISDIKIDLLSYQQYLRILGKSCLQSIQDPDNNAINQKIDESYQAINLLYDKLYFIVDLITMIENIPENTLTSKMQDLILNIKKHTESIKSSFIYLSKIAQEFDYLKIDSKDIFLLRLTRGDFFNKKDHDILESATIALLFRISPIAILDGIIAKFEQYNREQQQESLYFIENYLKSDTQLMLFSAVNPEKSEFYNKLIIFVNIAKQFDLPTDRLHNLIKEKNAKKQKFFLDMNTEVNEHTQDIKISYSLFELINSSFAEVNNQSLHEKILKKFINAIESEFAKIFTKIDISELREINWYKDEQRIQEGLNPNAPHVRSYHQHQEMVAYFIRFLIFYHMPKDGTPKHHSNLQQVKQIYDFIQSALLMALNIKAITTATILFKAIQISAIKRLKLSSAEAETIYQRYLSKTKEAQINLAKIFREKDVLPLLAFIQHKLLFIYKKDYGSQFELLSNIGSSLIDFENKKERIKNQFLSEDNYFEQMKHFLILLGIMSNENMDINIEKANRLLIKRSHDVKSDVTKKISLSELTTISNLKKHLLYCQSRSINFQLAEMSNEKDIIDWMLPIVKSDNRFIYFSDSIDSIYLMNDIAQLQHMPYKKMHADLLDLLSEYHQIVSDTLKSHHSKKNKSLDYFFTQYFKNVKLRAIKESDDHAFDLFSQQHKIKELLRKIDEKYKAYQNLQTQFEKQKSQQAYSQLLEDVLAGINKRTLQLPTDSDNANARHTETLLPENEYDIPSAEPEHPDRIGINRTMSFTNKEQTSILELFNTDELKIEFIAAFPWALQYDNINKLNQVSFDSTTNLLGTPVIYSKSLQLAIMKFVLLAMDALGKIAGFTGDLTIQNFDRISEIINQLKWITSELQANNVNESQFLIQVEANLQEMNFRNNEYFDMQQLYNPSFNVESNPNMNGFCHLNEHLVHQLVGVPYDTSMLAPNVPSSPYIEKITQIFTTNEKS